MEVEEAPGFKENERLAESESEDRARAQEEDELRQRRGGLLYICGSRTKTWRRRPLFLSCPGRVWTRTTPHCFPIGTSNSDTPGIITCSVQGRWALGSGNGRHRRCHTPSPRPSPSSRHPIHHGEHPVIVNRRPVGVLSMLFGGRSGGISARRGWMARQDSR